MFVLPHLHQRQELIHVHRLGLIASEYLYMVVCLRRDITVGNMHR